MGNTSQPTDLFPRPAHTSTTNKHGVAVPQTLAHRGYNQKYPENTLSAFRGAIEAGCHAIETDVRLTRDGVTVLAHDPTLERCFGVKKNVRDCDWEYVRTLETVHDPKDHVPRLVDLLEYLSLPGLEHIWIFLEIKLDNPTAIAAHLAQTFASCPSPKPWNTRIVLGCWSAAFLPACLEHLPSFPIALNCFDVSYARQFLRVPNIGFNMYQKVLMGPLARGFLEEARAAKRPVYVWTVNEENLMSWSLRKQLDGVVTDRPEEYRRLAESWTGNGDERIRASQTAEVWMASLVIVLFGWIFKRKYLPGIERVRFDGAVSK